MANSTSGRRRASSLHPCRAWAASGHRQHLRRQHVSIGPAGLCKPAAPRGEDDLVTGVIERHFNRVDPLRIDQSQVPQNRVNIAVFRLAELKAVGAEMNRGALVGKAPCQKGAAIHRMLKPGVERVWNVAVQEDFDGLLLLAGEFRSEEHTSELQSLR